VTLAIKLEIHFNTSPKSESQPAKRRNPTAPKKKLTPRDRIAMAKSTIERILVVLAIGHALKF